MSELIKNEASCLCGRVKIEVTNVNPKFTVCHCDTVENGAVVPFLLFSAELRWKFKVLKISQNIIHQPGLREVFVLIVVHIYSID